MYAISNITNNYVTLCCLLIIYFPSSAISSIHMQIVFCDAVWIECISMALIIMRKTYYVTIELGNGGFITI